MDRKTWQLLISVVTVVILAIAAAGVLWNAMQIDGVDSKIDELTGKVDTIETVLEEHVNSPDLHSELPAQEQELLRCAR